MVQAPPAPRTTDPAIPEALDRIITRYIQPDAGARYQSIAWLTRLAWVLAIGLLIAFVAMFSMHGEFRREIEKEWRDYRGTLVRASPLRGPGPAA